MNDVETTDPTVILRPSRLDLEYEKIIHDMLSLYAGEHGVQSDHMYAKSFSKADNALAAAVRRGMEIGWTEGYAAGTAPDAALRSNPYRDPAAERARREAGRAWARIHPSGTHDDAAHETSTGRTS
ncbi:hypothetical protein [Bifidobacterium myosotis]|uniref:Uncharacterized protein n=1 Tax=Bifidobacterium myosotis TaxID=1630166 RepID=A0A5M9ZKS3_9BIFI|nr:hypothetical protein [Bifidobacterium myosotis]KAA8828118.1 hypothetical protein EMO91_06670 [Bifidobacterium myosotis]